mgnify:CR=1 FL=1
MKVKFLSCYRGRTDENTFRAITRLRFELQTSRSHGLNRNAEIYPIRRSRAILRFWMFPGGFGGIPDRLFPQTVPPTIPPDRPPFRKLIPIVYLEGTNKYPNSGTGGGGAAAAAGAAAQRCASGSGAPRSRPALLPMGGPRGRSGAPGTGGSKGRFFVIFRNVGCPFKAKTSN